jgi:hypothetical protein
MMMEEINQSSEDDLIIKDIMSSIGWSDSFLPIANEDNRNLLDSIRYLGRCKLEREGALERDKHELARVASLYKNADYEFEQNLKLLTAHKSQLSTEYHLFKLSEHEDVKLKQTWKELDKEYKDLRKYEETSKGK